MKTRAMIDDLEPRKLLSVSVSTIGATGGNTASASRPGIALGPNTLYFNAVTQSNTSTANATDGNSSGGPHTSDYLLRLVNQGAVRVIIKNILVRGTDQSDFKVIAFPDGGISMAPGKHLDYAVRFTADSTPGVKTGFLVVNTDEKVYPQQRVPLRGLVTKGEGTTFEPSLQDVFDLYGFQINAGQQKRSSDPYFVASGTSDEVNISTLVKADNSKDIVLRPLAEFTNHATPDVRMGFYTPGQFGSEHYLWYSPSESSQSVTPLVYGQSTFDPGDGVEFGLVTQYPKFTNPDGTTTNVYSENTLNKRMYSSSTNSSLTHMKFYPYIDQRGNTVKNAYIVAEEEFNQDNVSDSQDLVFVITNVKPAAATPTLAVQNLTGFPSDQIASFNVVANNDPYRTNVVRKTNVIRLLNSGSAPLVVQLGITGDYSMNATAGTDYTIAPGSFKDVTVSFDATSSPQVHAGTLTITSNGGNRSVGLLGNWQLWSEQQGPGFPSVEPSAEVLVNDLLGYQTTIPSGSTMNANGSKLVYPGNEITAEYFQTADTDAPVNVTQLATYHNVTYVDSNGMNQPTASFMGWYKQGSPNSVTNILTDKIDQGQMTLGFDALSTHSGTVAHGTAKVSGTTTFGFVVEHQNSTDKVGEYSDHTLNIEPAGDSPTEQAKFGGLFLRFYQAVDAHGVPIPNTYLMLHDYNKSTTNYDFQDNIYLITNLMPAGAMKTPRTVYAQKNGASTLVNFTSPDDGPRVNGFNVYRSTTPADPTSWTKLNSSLLPRSSSGSFTDTTATGNSTYYYAVTTVGSGGVESDKYVVSVVG